MAISKVAASIGTSESQASTARQNFTGIAKARVICVNPTMEEYDSLLHFTPKEAPNYVSEQIDNGVTIKSARITYWMELLPELNNGVSGRVPITFWIRSNVRYNQDKSKVQVIDKYGNTAWLTIEQAKKHEVPVGPYGPMIDKEYKGCHVGEEELVRFIKNHINAPSKAKDPVGAAITLDCFDKYFQGDFTELKEAAAYYAENAVHILLGIKTKSDGNLVQDFYSGWFERGWSRDLSKFETKVTADKNFGRYPSTEFTFTPVKACDIQPSVVSAEPVFGGAEVTAQPAAAAPEDDDLPF